MEITSFVHPKYVPNMADAEEVFQATRDIGNFAVLVPNQRGMDRAKALLGQKVNVFFSASDSFNQANLGKNMDEIVVSWIQCSKTLIQKCQGIRLCVWSTQ